MKDGMTTTDWPSDPTKFYGLLGFREWFYGPFESAADAWAFRDRMNTQDAYWSYDGYAVYRGNPDAKTLAELVPEPRP